MLSDIFTGLFNIIYFITILQMVISCNVLSQNKLCIISRRPCLTDKLVLAKDSHDGIKIMSFGQYHNHRLNVSDSKTVV